MEKNALPTQLLRVFVKKEEGERLREMSRSNGHTPLVRFCVAGDLTSLLGQGFIEGNVHSMQRYSDGKEIPRGFELYALFFKPLDVDTSQRVTQISKGYLGQSAVKEGKTYRRLEEAYL